LLQLGDDRFKDAVHTLEDVVVPEAQDRQPVGIQESRSVLILGDAIAVLATVEFDDQPSFTAQEVADEWSDRHLAAEFEPA
jgi:hypothetical protein